MNTAQGITYKRCKICKGKGTVPTFTNGIMKRTECPACKGWGIISVATTKQKEK